MLIAECVCSDEDCAVTVEVVGDSLEAFELLVCEDCECTLQTLSLSELEFLELGQVIGLRRVRDLPRAA